MKRAFDFVFSLFSLVILIFPMLFIAALIKIASRGPILYWSSRVGKCNKIFKMPKFRTMKVATPEVATHLLPNPEYYLIPLGAVLRKLSLDELPQLWSVLCGHMSLVGPRPALFNQNDLIDLRGKYGVQVLLPGLTGLAQVSGRDDLSIFEKVAFDRQYLESQSLILDLNILWMTLLKVVMRSGVTH